MSFEQFRGPLTVTRITGGYVNGYWVDNPPTPVSITGSVQPANDKQRDNVPEGYDVESVMELGTESLLVIAQAAKPNKSDKVEIFGEQYTVVRLERWQNQIIPHYWYLVALPDTE